jgi:23S rRNA (adenine1618-N6)-methyltransferase
MHPRSPYVVRPDFAALARAYPSFARYVRGHELDWSHPQALVELCRVLLLRDFGVRWMLPDHALCPTVPSRLNYLLWLEDLLAMRGASDGHHDDCAPTVIGIDIGTGSSCIYPLLGAAHFGWRFVATEVDADSVEAARHNISLNNWHDRIEVRRVGGPPPLGERDGGSAPSADAEGASTTGAPDIEPPRSVGGEATPSAAERRRVSADGSSAPLLSGVLRDGERFDFCMCNPPWFAADETPRANKQMRPAHTRCPATRSEVFTAGGEVGFIGRLVDDSTLLRERVTWYSTLVGKKVSLTPVLRAVRAAGAVHVRSAELSQGSTSRWAVAWSFVEGAAPVLSPPERAIFKDFAAPAGLSGAEVSSRVTAYLEANGASFFPTEDPTEDDGEGRGEAAAEEAAVAAEVTLRGGAGALLSSSCASPPCILARACVLLSRSPLDSSSSLGVDSRGDATTSSSPAPPSVGHKRPHEARALPASSKQLIVEVSSLPPQLTTAANPIESVPNDAGASPPQRLRVALVAMTGGGAGAGGDSGGEAVQAFWRLAEQLRNDVVRDTRRWRRLEARTQPAAETS